MGQPDDDDVARQPAAVDRPPRRGRAARRAGPVRVPRDERSLRRDAGARPAQPGPRRRSGKKADAKRGVEESVSLGKQFGELGMALQGAAGVAMHLGAGEQALTLAEQVIERNESTGTTQGEASVLLALAHVRGRSLRRGAGRHRAGVGRATSRSASPPGPSCGRSPARAPGRSSDAEAVEATRGASYFDLALGAAGWRAGVLVVSATTRPAGAGSNSSARWRRRSATSCSSPSPSCSTTARPVTTTKPARWRRAGDASSTASSSADHVRRRHAQLETSMTASSKPSSSAPDHVSPTTAHGRVRRSTSTKNDGR